MKLLELVEMKLPAHWASYLINDDASSFDLYDDGAREAARIDILTEGLWCVAVSDDADFTWGSYDCPDELAGDYCTYTFQVLK